MPDAETGAITRQIQQATNIVDLIGQYVALKPAGANHKGLCPFHNEKTPSFYVSASKQIFKCFGCGAGGDVFTFLQLREGISFAEARAWLAQRAGIRLEPTSQDRPAGPDKNALARVNDWAARFFRRQLLEPGIGAVARQYLAGRKISQQTAEAFGLGYAPDRWDGLLTAAQARGISTGLLAAAGLIRPRSGGEGFYDTFRHRLIFPIRDLADRVIGFGGRTLGDDSAKYINSPETVLFEKGRNLYGLDLAKQPITRAGQAVIVEGYTDCLMAHQHGLAQTVATLGTALTEAHVQVLRRFADRAVVVFDPDEAGQRAADRALEVFLSQQLEVSLAEMPGNQDPCDFLLSHGRRAFEELLGRAVSALEYKWQAIARQHEASQPGPKRLRAIQEFLRVVAASAVFGAVDPIRRGLMLNQVGKLLGLAPQEVHRQLAAAQRTLSSAGPDRAARTTSAAAPVADAEQLAKRQIIEALLNQPHYYERVANYIEPGSLADRRLAAVAEHLAELCTRSERFDLPELIGRFEDPSYGRLITDLQLAGQRRGNYEATITGAVDCIRQARVRRELRQAGQQLREAAEPDRPRHWSAVLSKAREHRHFAPPKALGR